MLPAIRDEHSIDTLLGAIACLDRKIPYELIAMVLSYCTPQETYQAYMNTIENQKLSIDLFLSTFISIYNGNHPLTGKFLMSSRTLFRTYLDNQENRTEFLYMETCAFVFDMQKKKLIKPTEIPALNETILRQYIESTQEKATLSRLVLPKKLTSTALFVASCLLLLLAGFSFFKNSQMKENPKHSHVFYLCVGLSSMFASFFACIFAGKIASNDEDMDRELINIDRNHGLLKKMGIFTEPEPNLQTRLLSDSASMPSEGVSLV